MTTVKKYKIGNPRGIPQGVVILSFRRAAGSEEFDDVYERDAWVRPRTVTAAKERELIERGFLIEVTDG